jgi:hypothetical protein
LRWSTVACKLHVPDRDQLRRVGWWLPNQSERRYFDDPVHEVFGISSRDWQSFYHFTVGGPVEDKRLTTLPAYKFEEKR